MIKANNIPNSYKAVPNGLKLPYNLFDDCERMRNENNEIKKTHKRVKSNVKVKTIKTPTAEWMVGNQCTDRNGNTHTTWSPNKYPTRKAAEEAGKVFYE